MLEFPAQELRKYFKMGDHVKVIAGRFEGDTGLIVRVEENFVILFSDLTMHEVRTRGRTPMHRAGLFNSAGFVYSVAIGGGGV